MKLVDINAKKRLVRESSHDQNGRHCREVVTMIVVRITMHVLPEKQKELVQTLLSMIEPMEKEAGCLSYALFCNMEDKNLLNLLEEWQTRKDLDLYLRSEMFGVLLGTKSLLIEPHGIHIYTIHQSEGIEAVHTARGK
ncbi:MAG: antibiotic biosynthesis monooxygenase family protein [Desulfobacteraceae bacterium]|jgi:quinol monooxygenase YgiN|nr:antibiotic biosynthesis monooxygenase family protein [Desulfobacteraceae bacterium]